MYKWALRFLCWYICILYVQPQNRFPFLYGLHIADLSVMGCLGCHFLGSMQGQSPLLRFGHATKLGIALLVLAFLSLYLGAYMTWHGWNPYIDILAKSVLVMILIEVICDTPQKVWVIQTTTVLATLWWVKGGLRLSAAGATFSGDRLMGPAVSLIENPNGFAYMMCTVIPLYLYFYQQARSKMMRYVFLAIALFAVYIVLETGSRTGLLCLIAIGIFLFPKYGARHKKALIMGGVAIFFIMSSVGTMNIERFKSIPQAFKDFMTGEESEDPESMTQDKQSAWERSMKNKHTWRLILAHPLMGAGIAPTEGMYADEFPYATGQVHSEILMAGRQMGFPGIIMYLLLLHAIFYSGHKVQRHCKGWWPEMSDLGWTFKMQGIAFAVGGFFSPLPWNAPMLVVVGSSCALWAIVRVIEAPSPVVYEPPPMRKPRPFVWQTAAGRA